MTKRRVLLDSNGSTKINVEGLGVYVPAIEHDHLKQKLSTEIQQLKDQRNAMQVDLEIAVKTAETLKTLTAERDQLKTQLKELEAIVHPDDKSKYLGFTVSQMLYHLSKDCKEVELTAKGESYWCLHVLSDQCGEFEMQGGLMFILGQASKPFLKQWTQERLESKSKMDNILASVKSAKAGA